MASKSAQEGFENIMWDLEVELSNAMTRFASFNSPHEGWAVIKEELDELWELVRANEGRTPAAIDEARQIAAMAIRYILDLRGEPA